MQIDRILFFSIFFVLSVSNAFSFSIPENLHYELTLAGVKIGSLALEVQDRNQNIQLTSKVTAQKWLSLFYEVDDTVVSVLSKGGQKDKSKEFPFAPLTYRVQLHEGRHKVSKEFVFDHNKKHVLYKDNLEKNKANYVLKDFTLDPLSSLYYLRRIPLQVGKSVTVAVFNNQLVYKIEIQVLKKEQIKTSLGTFNTILVRSNMSSTGDGVFYLPGDIYIWLTDDDKRIPVLFEKRVNALVEGNIPGYVKDKIPDYFMKKLSEGSVKAYLIKK